MWLFQQERNLNETGQHQKNRAVIADCRYLGGTGMFYPPERSHRIAQPVEAAGEDRISLRYRAFVLTVSAGLSPGGGSVGYGRLSLDYSASSSARHRCILSHPIHRRKNGGELEGSLFSFFPFSRESV